MKSRGFLRVLYHPPMKLIISQYSSRSADSFQAAGENNVRGPSSLSSYGMDEDQRPLTTCHCPSDFCCGVCVSLIDHCWTDVAVSAQMTEFEVDLLVRASLLLLLQSSRCQDFPLKVSVRRKGSWSI